MSQQDAASFRIGTPQIEEPVAVARYEDPGQAAPSGYGLSGLCVIPAIAGIALLAVFPRGAIAQESLNMPLHIAFNAAILLGIAFVGSIICFFMFGKSRTVASLAFTFAIGLMSAGRFAPSTVAGAQAAVSRAVGISSPSTSNTKAVTNPEMTAPANLAQLAVSADTSSLTGSPAAETLNPRLAVSAKRWIRTASQLATTYRAAREQFEFGGGLELAELKSRRECSDRLAILTRLQQANEAFAGYINSAPATMQKLLSEDGIGKGEAEPLIEGFLGGFNYDLQVSLRQTRAEFISNAQEMLQLARDREGQWTFDQKSGLLIFKNKQDTRNFAQSATKAREAAARDLELQRELDTSSESLLEAIH